MKINPQIIVERHEKYPDATKALIEGYAYGEYRAAIDDIHRIAEAISSPEKGVVILIIRAEDWAHFRAGEMSKHKYSVNDTLPG